MKVYTPEELAGCAGKEGRQTLVAVNGKVYDLSASKRWIAGQHMKRHNAGADLSTDILGAPHVPEVLERFEVIGTFDPVAQEPRPGVRGKVDAWLDAHPFFRRHPHPAVVHFPVGLGVAAVVFQLLALIFSSPKTEWAAFCCVAMVLAALPVTILTGLFTWWINYDCMDSKVLAWKRRLGYLALPVALVAVISRLSVAHPLNLADSYVLLYMACLFGLGACVSIVGFLGGLLTFPYDHH